MISDFDKASEAASALLRAAKRQRVRIKQFKISREQASLYAAQLSSDSAELFATEDKKSTLLGRMLAGRCTFDNVPVKVIA